MVTHKNSRKAFATVDKGARHTLILDACKTIGAPLTDRQILYVLDVGNDLNYVRPRITELIISGDLIESGKVKCNVTGRTVRTVELSPLSLGLGGSDDQRR